MIKSKIILLCLLLFNSYSFVLAQENNPFEVRKKNVKELKEQDKSGSENNNIFDLKSKEIQDAELIKVDSSNPFELLNNNSQKPLKKDKEIAIPQSERKSSFIKDFTKKSTEDNGFLFWVFLFVLIFIAILLTANRDLILKIFKAVWFYNLTNSLYRDFGNRELLFYLLLFATFVVNMAIFLYLLLGNYHQLSGLNLFLVTAAVVLSVYLIKYISIAIFSNIFSSIKGLNIYNFTILLFNISLGFILLPINLIIAYSIPVFVAIFIYVGIFFIVGLFLLRLFRGFLITINYFNISKVHYFLYLCAFEIIPLLFLYKFIVKFL